MFEVLIENGRTFRFETPDYRWQYRLVPGTMDVLNTSEVEVFRMLKDDEEELVLELTGVVAAGSIDLNTCLRWPTIKRTSQCPRCGYQEVCNA